MKDDPTGRKRYIRRSELEAEVERLRAGLVELAKTFNAENERLREPRPFYDLKTGTPIPATWDDLAEEVDRLRAQCDEANKLNFELHDEVERLKEHFGVG